jgi:hypothetical protein
MQVTYQNPYDVELILERDPISHPELQTDIPRLRPEERMD